MRSTNRICDCVSRHATRFSNSGDGATAHEFERFLGHTDGAHTVVDSARPEATLRHLETAPGAENDVVIIDAEGSEDWPRMSKDMVARKLAERIAQALD